MIKRIYHEYTKYMKDIELDNFLHRKVKIKIGIGQVEFQGKIINYSIEENQVHLETERFLQILPLNEITNIEIIEA